MTPTQIAGIVRVALPALLSLVLPHITEDIRTQIVTLVVAVIGSGSWSYFSLSGPRMAQTVASIDGLQVHVNPDAAPAFQRLAADQTVKDIVRG